MVTRSGIVVPVNLNGRAGTQTMLTNSSGALSGPLPNYGGDAEAYAMQGAQLAPVNFLWVLLGLFAILIVMKYATEHAKSGMQVHFLGVGVYNWIAVTLLSILGIVTLKTIFNKYYVKGITEIFNAV